MRPLLRLASYVMKVHEPGYSQEGDGVVVTCSCSWLRWLPDRPRAEAAWTKHVPKPKE